MKVAIFSDIHDNVVNMNKATDFIKKEGVEMIIFCGDFCAPSVLRELAKNFSGQIHLIFGNVDGDHYLSAKMERDFKNVKIYNELGEVELDGKKIAFIHFPKIAQGLAKSGKYDLVFYGHNHKPWEEKVGECILANPGTLGGLFYRASFALYDTKTNKLELKILDQI
jgi:hypothetical protein